MVIDFEKKFYKKHDLIKSKNAKHAAIMKKMQPNYGKGRELTEKERNPRLISSK